MNSNFNEARCKALCNHYEAQCGCSRGQSGGMLPVFSGARHQYGAGLGDILRGIFRRVAPIIGPALKSTLGTFFGEASSGLNQGKSFKESFQGALKPSMRTALTSTMENFNKSEQEGSGRRRRRSPRLAAKEKGKPRPKSSTRGVYKRKKTTAGKHLKKRKLSKIQFSNF